MTTRFFTITHDIGGIRVHDSENESSVCFGNVADLGYAYAGRVVAQDTLKRKIDAISKLAQIISDDLSVIRELKTEIQAIIAR